MADEPDLMAELDAAEEAMNGITRVIKWGYREGTLVSPVSNEQRARAAVEYRRDRLGRNVTLVKCEVTYGAWEDA